MSRIHLLYLLFLSFIKNDKDHVLHKLAYTLFILDGITLQRYK